MGYISENNGEVTSDSLLTIGSSNCVLIIGFSILYWIADLVQIEDMSDPWYYWLYFSGITQTTIGYAGIEYKGKPGVNIMTIKSTILLCFSNKNIKTHKNK